MFSLKRLLFASAFLACAFLHPLTVVAQSIDDLADRPVALRTAEPETAGKRTVTTARSTTATGIFTGVALHGLSHGEHLEGWVRFDDDSTWGSWQPLYITRSATDGFFAAAYRSDAVRTDAAFELRFAHGESIVIRETDSSLYTAIDRAAGRCKRTLLRRLEQLASRRRRSTRRAVRRRRLART